MSQRCTSNSIAQRAAPAGAGRGQAARTSSCSTTGPSGRGRRRWRNEISLNVVTQRSHSPRCFALCIAVAIDTGQQPAYRYEDASSLSRPGRASSRSGSSSRLVASRSPIRTGTSFATSGRRRSLHTAGWWRRRPEAAQITLRARGWSRRRARRPRGHARPLESPLSPPRPPW